MKKTFKKFSAVAAVAVLCSCSSPSGLKSSHEAPTPTASSLATAAESPARPLTEREAQARFKQVMHVAYALEFDLGSPNADADGYSGRTTVRFRLRPKAADHGSELLLDFRGGPGGTVSAISLNGQALTNPGARYDGNRIRFAVSELRPGDNQIEISFARKYGTNGHGLYHFKDPVDGKTYLYTDDEPYFAHELFPCFDQPDLKATYQLTVSAPPAWVVVTNTLEKDTRLENGPGGPRKIWSFPPTQPISTYLVALIAGDYVSWKSSAATSGGEIPTRLFARASLKRYVDHDEWLDITRRGLDFYSSKFGYPYPYGKYDQILVPDFDEGAMENVGAVTFTEDYVFRTRQTRLAHLDRADTILHEMAHMWFGDLVTMKWWNGLWLNESFATFMSAWSVADATKYKESWQSFFGGDKNWAYWQDQLVTTHPIDLPVPDTDHAFSNFDGITYGKGAAVLKQLRFFLGDDDFIEGIQRYFDRYAQRNSTLRDFIRMLEEASGKNLGPWQAAWLKTQGVNTVQAEWSCTGSKISSFDLLQGNGPESSVLRPHKTQVALFTDKGGKFVPRELIPVTYSEAKTDVSEAIGKPCPVFVYPNYGDEDYVKVELDPVSLERMTRDLAQIEDPFVRQMYWEDLWNSVVDGKLPAKSYAEAAIRSLATEHDLLVIDDILANVSQSNLARNSAMKFISPAERTPLRDRLEHVLLTRLRDAHPGSDLQLAYFNAFVDSVHTLTGVSFISGLLTRKQKISGLRIDQDVRWSLVKALARSGAPDALERIDAETRSDPSHFGQIHRLEALAQIPTQENKDSWFAKIIAAGNAGGSTKELSSSDLRAVMSNFAMLGQEKQIENLVSRYFDYLPKAAASPDEEFMYEYTRHLFPGVCDSTVVDLTTRALANKKGGSATPFPAQAQKNLRTHLQEEQRCMRARGRIDPILGSAARPGNGPSPKLRAGSSSSSRDPRTPRW